MMPSGPAAVAADDRAAVSPLLMVVVTLEGVMLPEVDGVPSRALGLGELRLLEALAGRGAPSLGAVGSDFHDGDGLEGFVDELRMRGLITAPGARAATRAFEGVDAPAAEREPADSDQLVLVTPVILRLGPGGFEHFDHDGRVRIRLDAVELVAAGEFRRPVTSAQARLGHKRRAGASGLGERAFTGLVHRLIGAGLLERFDPDDPSLRALSRQDREMRRAVARQRVLAAAVVRRLAEHDAAERERETRTGTTRTPVMPVHFQWQLPPLALG
ncbi:MAG TPA: hypothetical protein VKU61_02365, partial [Candidatus Binatia bacterium]|nr:hypothetical protein [Candidatus Binatia bacterium]